VGAGYFDSVTETITAGTSSIAALKGSTEEEQFTQVGQPQRKTG
jgi:isocitrate lyase